jgi:hypothetical protein
VAFRLRVDAASGTAGLGPAAFAAGVGDSLGSDLALELASRGVGGAGSISVNAVVALAATHRPSPEPTALGASPWPTKGSPWPTSYSAPAPGPASPPASPPLPPFSGAPGGSGGGGSVGGGKEEKEECEEAD